MSGGSRTWLLEDASISTRGQDRFDHESVAVQLADLVRSAQHPTAVGLLGPFGSGKSSVVRLLAERLAVDGKLAVLQVSAEHHSGTARARAMLYGLLGAAHREGLIDEQVHDDERACLEGSRQRTVPRPSPKAHRPGKAGLRRYAAAARAGAGWIVAMVVTLWLLGTVAVVVGHLFGLGHGVVPWRWFAAKGTAPLTAVLGGAAVVAGAVTAAKDGAVRAFGGYDISVTTPRPDSTDELEQVFSRLIDEIHRRKLKRLVIAIDDIDRLNADEVLEALATIRSLLLAGAHGPLKPVFIISCDEDIVREAIMGVNPGLAHRQSEEDDRHGERRATEEAAQEYLNKLFSVRLTLPAHHDQDLLEYSEHLLVHPQQHPVVGALGGMEATRAVLETLVHPAVREPRHAIRLLNAFLADYGLARRREQPWNGRPARIAPGEVTGFPLELARLAVLRNDFRRLYDRVERENALLFLLDDALLGTSEALEDALLRDFRRNEDDPNSPLDTDRWPGLSYLRATAWRTRAHRPPQLSALITLGSPAASRDLGSETAQAIALELQQRDSQALCERLRDAGQRPRVLNAVRNTIAGLRPGLGLDNAIAAAVQALGGLPDLARGAVSAPGQDAAGQQMTALTELLARRRAEAPGALPDYAWAPLLTAVPGAYLSSLVGQLAQRPEDRDQERPWAQALFCVPQQAAFAPRLRDATSSYFASLTASGTQSDLDWWLGAGRGQENWPAAAFGAVLAMAARSGSTDTLDLAAEAARAHADAHRWDHEVVDGLTLDWDTVASDVKRWRLAVLGELELPPDCWGAGVEGEGPGVTAAGWLACQLAQFLCEDDDLDSSLQAQQLLESWLPVVGPQPAAGGAGTCGTVIIEAFALVALEEPELAQAAARLLPRLPEADAAAFVQRLAKELPTALDGLRADHLNAVYTMLTAYLERADDARSGPAAQAADEAFSVLAASLTGDSDAGQLARLALPSWLATKRGQAQAGHLVDTLVQAIPLPLAGAAPLPGLPGEILTSLHTLLAHAPTRQAGLGGVLQRLQASMNQGHVSAGVDFVARYLNDTQVNQFWITHIDQQWAAVTAQARDLAVRGAERDEVWGSALGTRLAAHIPQGSDMAWPWAARLWPRAERQAQVDMLALNRGRCADLTEHGAQVPSEILIEALHRAGEQLADVVGLCAGNPALNTSLTSYLHSAVHSEEVNVHLVREAVRASTDPVAVWDMALEAAAEDQDSACRAAAVISALLRTDPGSAPTDLVDRLAPVLKGADPAATQALGEAVVPLPRRVRGQLSDAIPRDGKARGRRTDFRKAAGL